LILTGHQPQPGRWGTGGALAAAEHVFAADTRAAIAQIRAASAAIPGQALAAASMLHLATAFAPDPVAGCRDLLRVAPRSGTTPTDRALREVTVGLSDPDTGPALLDDTPLGQAVQDAWNVRARALAAYRHQLDPGADRHALLRALLHRHHVRALGADPDFERATAVLARAGALRQLAARGQRP
jgi:thiopeptide-type bacteriocin biosynthesis protein